MIYMAHETLRDRLSIPKTAAITEEEVREIERLLTLVTVFSADIAEYFPDVADTTAALQDVAVIVKQASRMKTINEIHALALSVVNGSWAQSSGVVTLGSSTSSVDPGFDSEATLVKARVADAAQTMDMSISEFEAFFALLVKSFPGLLVFDKAKRAVRINEVMDVAVNGAPDPMEHSTVKAELRRLNSDLVTAQAAAATAEALAKEVSAKLAKVSGVFAGLDLSKIDVNDVAGKITAAVRATPVDDATKDALRKEGADKVKDAVSPVLDGIVALLPRVIEKSERGVPIGNVIQASGVDLVDIRAAAAAAKK
jgi:hypothetical protein